MDEDPDGNNPQRVERTQQVTGWFSVKPVDDVSFTEHDEGLQRHRQVRQTVQRDRYTKEDYLIR